MHKIRWIHFSDLHLGNSNAVDTVLMRKKLPPYISGLNQSYDYAFCTGDIKEWNSDYSGAAEYLCDICSSANIPLEHLFIVPGNHDISIGGADRAALIEKLKSWETDDYSSSVGTIAEDDLAILRSGEGQFQNFIGELLGPDRASCYTEPHFVVRTEHFNILHMDSTLTYGKNNERDFIIGTRMLMDALEICDPSKPTILLTHYSFDFLAQAERNQVETLLHEYHVQLWFAGHEHENLIRKQRDKFYECQCGNLVLQKGARSCFLSGEMDLDTGEGIIMVHAWYEGRDWEVYPFARLGAEDNRLYPFAISLPGVDRIGAVSATLANAREACEALASAGGVFSGVQMNPSILTDLEWEGKYFVNSGAPYPLIQVMRELWGQDHSHNALILGDGGMGKSTMMYHACKTLLDENRLAVYISLQAQEGAGNRSLTEFVLHSLFKSTDERATRNLAHLTSTRHPRPDLILFIDGFNELSGPGAQRYVAEIKTLSQYPGIQIIVSSRLDFLRDYGLSFFGMIHPCDLREDQVKSLFSTQAEEWKNIEAQKNLRILVKNPMMALLYASTCPIVNKHADLDYLNWITPIANASDLLHDYYMSQIAILIDRQAVDGNRIMNCMVAVTRVLPALGYAAERRNTTIWAEEAFDEELYHVVASVNQDCFGEGMPAELRRIKRHFRLETTQVDSEALYNLIITEMCLLKAGNGRISFAHQIFRDYLSAVYLHNCLTEDRSVKELWHDEKIHGGVVQYLRNIGDEATWGAGGQVSAMLSPYRGKEAATGDWFVANVINCWLSIGEGERDLSSLDLRKVSLSEHLKAKFTGTINIDGAWLSKETLINDRHHDRIVAINFSHDSRTMAAVSKNGIVSITNLLTQSQTIIKQLSSGKNVRIGFDADDYLIVRNALGVTKWPTVAYDKTEDGNEDDILDIAVDESNEIAALKKRLEESDLYGVYRAVSENGKYLAVGFESGFIQVWDVFSQDCIANLSLSDSQIATVSFTADGKVAALGSGGKLVQIWDMSAMKCIRTLYFDRRVNKVKLPSHGNHLECQFSDGKYIKVDLATGAFGEAEKPHTAPFVSKSLLKRISSMKVVNIQPTPKGNAIILTSNGQAYVWDESLKKLSPCLGHNSQVTAIAACSADERFAASYSPEKYRAGKNDGDRRKLLDGQQIVRVRIIKNGQCQWRLPTKGRSITKLQFFTSNRIILAGYATNGDILLWELINEQKFGREIGRWESVEIVKNNQAEPIECAFPTNKKDFISAYSDGTILIRPFSSRGQQVKIATLPGIDAGVFRWNSIKCDDELRRRLEGYPHLSHEED